MEPSPIGSASKASFFRIACLAAGQRGDVFGVTTMSEAPAVEVSPAVDSELRIPMTATGTQRWLVLDGDLDSHTSPALERLLGALAEEGVTDVVMDLTPVRRFDDTGVAVLLEAVDGPWELRWRRPTDDTVAAAQGTIAGTVKDTSGAVMPGVTVEASSPALIEKTRSVVTDATGQYRIVDLRPGGYAVTFTLPGFATVKREGVELTGNEIVSANLWGFLPAFRAVLDSEFEVFTSAQGDDPAAEFLIGDAVSRLGAHGQRPPRVVRTPERFLGVTYKEDVEGVRKELADKVAAGEYPSPLWR